MMRPKKPRCSDSIYTSPLEGKFWRFFDRVGAILAALLMYAGMFFALASLFFG